MGERTGPRVENPLQGRHPACHTPVRVTPRCLSVSVLVFSISRFLNNNFAPSPLVPGRRGAGQEETAGDRDVAGGNDG